MHDDRRGHAGSLSALEAGEVLGLPADVVRALADAGYLHPSLLRGGVPRFALADLEAFRDRRRAGHGPLLLALGDRSAAIAGKVLQVLSSVLPAVAGFDDVQRARVVREARERVEAILAVSLDGAAADDTDLAAIGADAARRGVALPAVLLTLRATRDLVVQTAVEIAEDSDALAVTLSRLVSSVDRLSDAVARGYWETVEGG